MGFITGTLLVVGGAIIGNQKNRKKITTAAKITYKKGEQIAKATYKKGQGFLNEVTAKMKEEMEIREEAQKIVQERKKAAQKKTEDPEQIEEK